MELKHFHAHVYFDAGNIEAAADLRNEIRRRFPVLIGRLYPMPVGPHPKGMFQVAFDQRVFGELVPWLMVHRQHLSVLVHGESGDDLDDHTRYLIWLGDALPLHLDRLPPQKRTLSAS